MHLDPYDPAMPVYLGVGPITASPCPTDGRSSMVSRSPLTMTVFDTEGGGRSGTQLKRAGLDHVILRGRAPVPSLVRIEDGKIRVEPCPALWGLGVHDTVAALRREGASVLCIGPAGERLVRFANVMIEGHFNFGRGGAGAVWGKKNLKAVVIRGTGRTLVSDRDALARANRDIRRMLDASPVVMGKLGLREVGTTALLDLMHARRMMPTRNFSATHFPGEKKVSPHAVKATFGRRRIGCSGCPIQCKKTDESRRPLPEFESTSHLSALNDNADAAAVVEANLLCNDMGLDTISTAATLSCYGEHRGKFAVGEEMKSLVRKIAMREEGLGDALAEGSARWADANGCSHLSISVKGLELPGYDPRGAYGMALGYAVAGRGGCHLRAYPIKHEILRKPIASDRFSFDGKARIVKIEEDANAMVDSLIACKFAFFGATIEEYAKVLSAVTGLRYEAQDLLWMGERVIVLERDINARNGFSRKDDRLPDRFFEAPGSSGEGIEIPPLPREEFEATLGKYYRIRGCDDSGVPTKETLKRLGL
jgi:aldehyde:ferredoxin oxidoreductase